MTIYRAGGDSPIIRSLIRAAERGVKVAALVEKYQDEDTPGGRECRFIAAAYEKP